MAAATKLVGKLTLNVVAGKGLKDMELIGKMDPYVVLKCGKEEFKTKVQKKAGCNPTFNQSFIFNLEGKEDVLHVNVLDEELVSDAHIGRADLNLLNLVKTDKATGYQLVSKDDFKKVTGELILKVESFIGTGAPNPAVHTPTAAASPVHHHQPQQQQQVVYQQQPQVVYQQQQQPRVVVMQQPQMMAQPQLVQGADGKLYAIQQPMQAQPQVVYMQQPMQPQVMYMQQPKQ